MGNITRGTITGKCDRPGTPSRGSVQHARHLVLARLGAAILRARKELGVSQERLALESDIDRSWIGTIRRGEQNVGVVHRRHISQALRISLAELLRQRLLRSDVPRS